MSAKIAQRFAAIDRRSNGSHRVSLVYKLHPTLTLTPSPSSRSVSSPLPPHPPPSRRPAGRSREVGQLGFAVTLAGQPEPQGSRERDTPSPHPVPLGSSPDLAAGGHAPLLPRRPWRGPRPRMPPVRPHPHRRVPVFPRHRL
jgi:hypothetical protein